MRHSRQRLLQRGFSPTCRFTIHIHALDPGQEHSHVDDSRSRSRLSSAWSCLYMTYHSDSWLELPRKVGDQQHSVRPAGLKPQPSNRRQKPRSPQIDISGGQTGEFTTRYPPGDRPALSRPQARQRLFFQRASLPRSASLDRVLYLFRSKD